MLVSREIWWEVRTWAPSLVHERLREHKAPSPPLEGSVCVAGAVGIGEGRRPVASSAQSGAWALWRALFRWRCRREGPESWLGVPGCRYEVVRA